jgi:RecJ-like exonuclease
MKCYKCNGTGYYDIDNECPVCDGTGEYEPFDTDVELDKLDSEPITNEEWRKTCSTEEFAEWISNLAYACMRCGMSNNEAYCHTGYCIQDKEDAEKWLKEIHE